MKGPQPFIFVAVLILCLTLMVVESGAVFK
jgi:hypothetical protein